MITSNGRVRIRVASDQRSLQCVDRLLDRRTRGRCACERVQHDAVVTEVISDFSTCNGWRFWRAMEQGRELQMIL